MTTYELDQNGPTEGSRGTALIQPGRSQNALVLVNVGSTTIYLDDQNVPNPPESGQPLSAGSSIPWDAGRALYACAATGQSATLLTSNNTGVPFDAGAIAGQLLAQGLATDIATAVYLQGVPLVDNPTILVQGNTTTNAGLQVPVTDLDISRYSTLTVSTLLNDSFSAPAPTSYGYAYILQRPEIGGFITDFKNFGFLADHHLPLGVNSVSRFDIPARGRVMDLQLGCTAGGKNLAYNIVGSYRQTDRTLLQGGHGYWGASGIGTTNGNGVDGRSIWTITGVPAATTYQEWPNILAGPGFLTFRCQNALPAGGADYFLLDYFTTAVLAGNNLPAGFIGSDVVQLDLPAQPVALYFRNRSAAAIVGDVSLSLLQDIR